MTVEVTQTPTYQIPGKPFFLNFSASTGNYVRVMVTAAPAASQYTKRMEETQTSELELGDTATGQIWTGFEPDVPGVYTLKAYELTIGASSYGGYFSSDHDGYASETVIGSTSLTMYVGQRLESAIGTDSDNATLVLYVWDYTVRATSVELHGEDSPALINPSSSRAETFASDADVVAELALFEDREAPTVASSASSILDNFLLKFTGHLTEVGVHNANDGDNTPQSGLYTGAKEVTQLVTAIATAQRLFKQHITNDKGDGVGPGGGSYHSVGDWVNGPVAGTPEDVAGALFALGDLWRAYEAHRASTTFHAVADVTNTLSALNSGSLVALAREVSEVLATPTPTAPSTDNQGATTLVHSGGMKRS
jgi:hypothetical protein